MIGLVNTCDKGRS